MTKSANHDPKLPVPATIESPRANARTGRTPQSCRRPATGALTPPCIVPIAPPIKAAPPILLPSYRSQTPCSPAQAKGNRLPGSQTSPSILQPKSPSNLLQSPRTRRAQRQKGLPRRSARSQPRQRPDPDIRPHFRHSLTCSYQNQKGPGLSESGAMPLPTATARKRTAKSGHSGRSCCPPSSWASH